MIRHADRDEVIRYARQLDAQRRPTDPQMDALEAWAQGLGYKRIAALLGIGSSSARQRVERGLEKLERCALEDAA